jgi:hypothetical protein
LSYFRQRENPYLSRSREDAKKGRNGFPPRLSISASQRLRERIGFWCFEATKTVLSQSARRTQRKKALQSVSFAPSRLCERTGFCRSSDGKKTHVSREAAKPQRKALNGFPPRLGVSARKSASGASKPQELFSRRARGERREKKALQTVSFAPSRLGERIRPLGFFKGKKTHVSREAAKEGRNGFPPRLSVSASPRLRVSARKSALGVSKPQGLFSRRARGGRREERALQTVSFASSRLRVFARGPAFVVSPTGRKPMSLAKPRRRKGGQEWVFSASPRENQLLVFRSHKDSSLAEHAENAE